MSLLEDLHTVSLCGALITLSLHESLCDDATTVSLYEDLKIESLYDDSITVPLKEDEHILASYPLHLPLESKSQYPNPEKRTVYAYFVSFHSLKTHIYPLV